MLLQLSRHLDTYSQWLKKTHNCVIVKNLKTSVVDWQFSGLELNDDGVSIAPLLNFTYTKFY